MRAERSAAVELRQVTKVYISRQGEPVRAVHDVDLDIREGEFVSVVGPSGCGKSTVLSMVAGLISPSAGEVRIGGVLAQGPQTDMGIVFQTDALLEWRTALGNVLLQAEARGMKGGEAEQRARALLASVGLEGFEQARPQELSGGMRQRVALCRALVHDPPVLLMDEPFGALDALTRDQLGLDLANIWDGQERKTAMFITHDIREAAFLSDRVVIMTPRPGRVHAVIDVGLPRPRGLAVRDTPEFARVLSEIRGVLEAEGAYA